MLKTSLLAAVFTSILSVPSFAQPDDKSTFTMDDMFQIKRLGDPQLSPDGKWVAYTMGTVDYEKNKVVNHIWITSSKPGGEPRQLTNSDKSETRPRWSPDGKWIAFQSARGGSSQLWIISPEGGEAKAITNIGTGAAEHVWSPTGKMLAFISDVYPDCDSEDCNKKREEQIAKSGVTAKTIDHLLYRHWTEWRDGKRSHLFLVDFDSENPKVEKARDLTPGNFEVPPFSLGGPDAYAFSPDGKEVAYTRGPDASVEAWSTNADLWVMSVDGSSRTNLTEDNKGWDGSPVYSPTGRYIAFRSQKREGYEADLVRPSIYDRQEKKTKRIFPQIVDSIEEIGWADQGDDTLFMIAEDEGNRAIWWGVNEGGWLFKEGACTKLFTGENWSGLSFVGKNVIAMRSTLDRPAEIIRIEEVKGIKEKPKNNPENLRATSLVTVNDALFKSKTMPSFESVWYEGAKGAKVQAWVVKPANFDKTKKYPFLYFIHGGPQGAWMNAFSFRWNPMLYAAQGYVVMLPNPHGSTGFGQDFTEQISGDWAGACYEDLMKGVDWAIAQGFVDENKMGAAGGSFGGYMVNWILGHNNRFKALVSHAGVYNLESMYGVTEEVWFPEWELGGTPWKHRDDLYNKFSPHKFAANFKTPTLVIHGELDFRVPIGEGLQLFTALQRQGVPSKLLYYPDEGHWVLKPKNSRLWNDSVLGWFDKYVKGQEKPSGGSSGDK